MFLQPNITDVGVDGNGKRMTHHDVDIKEGDDDGHNNQGTPEYEKKLEETRDEDNRADVVMDDVMVSW
jgi:hypothetical protein